MRTLTVLFDAECVLCCAARSWLGEQPAFVRLDFVPAASAEARRRFPTLDHEASRRQITVVGDRGEVWRDAKAWVMCLWALREHRTYAMRIASPAMMPLARRFVAFVARNRRALPARAVARLWG